MAASYTNVIDVTGGDTVGTTHGIHVSAIIYEASPDANTRFGVGGDDYKIDAYTDASVLWVSSSLYGTSQFGTVSSIAAGSVTFTTEISAVSGDTFTKVQTVPENSTTAFTFPAKSQNEQLRKHMLGYF